MHILDEKFRKELVDIYEGKVITVFRRPEDIFNKVLIYFAGNCDTADKIYEVKKLIDALADWTHNPTESELRKILDVKEKVSGYIINLSFAKAIRVISFCATRGIPFSAEVGTNNEYQKVSFKDITISQRDAIIKMGNNIHFISSQLYPKENGKEN